MNDDVILYRPEDWMKVGEARGRVSASDVVISMSALLGWSDEQLIEMLCKAMKIERRGAEDAYAAYKHDGEDGLKRVFDAEARAQIARIATN